MYYVYILVSTRVASKIYVGFTTDLNKRLEKHNSRQTAYAKRYVPWRVRTYLIFDVEHKARQFEKYLKSGSGFAFLKRRLI
jgi:predicted GIY-YIG superfamily endonuclease